jgi:hypothetical protein
MFGLLDEIINHHNICNIKINESVSDFFISNHQFCYLSNRDNEHYEIPVVGYVGRKENKLNFTYIFGNNKDVNNPILGPFYYFTDFNNVVINQLKSLDYKTITKLFTKNSNNNNNNNNNNKNGIVRFALFMGLTKYIENQPNDPIDESIIKKERLNDSTMDPKFEQLTMRVTDYDGIWSNTYDSCYLGQIDLDNGEKMPNVPLFVLKDYSQQVPLSYHFIAKNSDITNKYSII